MGTTPHVAVEVASGSESFDATIGAQVSCNGAQKKSWRNHSISISINTYVRLSPVWVNICCHFQKQVVGRQTGGFTRDNVTHLHQRARTIKRTSTDTTTMIPAVHRVDWRQGLPASSPSPCVLIWSDVIVPLNVVVFLCGHEQVVGEVVAASDKTAPVEGSNNGKTPK